MNDENKPLNDAEDNKALDSQENAVPNAEKASEAPHNNTEKEETEANNRPTGNPLRCKTNGVTSWWPSVCSA